MIYIQLFLVIFHFFWLPKSFFKKYLKKVRILYSIDSAILMLGVFPILLGFILIFIKSSQDPLEGVSKLDAILSISSNQHKHENFEQNIYKSQDWKALSKQE